MEYSVKFLQDSFLSFFKNKSHTILPSSSPIPNNDQTLLFTNAGMNQFKNYFMGLEIPPYDPITTAQRCIRAGGKHNDLDQVGFTKRHLTHFTMLGNFSFGAYFKEKAISYAWEYLTMILGIEAQKLWITVFQDDDQAYQIWHKTIGIPTNRIFKLGEKDNFWQMGDTGPCGPCSEIYYDRGINNISDAKSFPSDDKSDRFIEIWNLVFIQFERQKDGSFIPLKNPGIDTGMGLERLATVLQNKDSVFQTDAFTHIILAIEKLSGIYYTSQNAATFHVLCDHIRTASLLIANSIIPHNEGRGYVLRKIIRRALLFSRELSQDVTLFASLASSLVDSQESLYHDLADKKDLIYQTIFEESKKFFDNLEQGITVFQSFLSHQKNDTEFSGKDAFILYDTYGFPLEITTILANKQNRTIDITSYEEAMKEQRERSKAHAKFKQNDMINRYNGQFQTEFIGYHTFTLQEKIIDIIAVQNEDSENKNTKIVIFQKTIFYPGGGGQIADAGWILYDNIYYPVIKIIKYQEAIGIMIEDKSNIIKTGQIVEQIIDKKKRIQTAIHHSAVHLLHKAIINFFDDPHIYQDGSYVSDNYFSIDIVTNKTISFDDKKNIEDKMNEIVNQGITIQEKYMSLDQAIKEGATAQFTEKYNKDNVRVIDMSPFTLDLCGGCHATNTKQLGIVLLTEISSIRAGAKRFIGVAGKAAIAYIRQLEEATNDIKKQFSCSIENISKSIIKKNESEKTAQIKSKNDIKTLFMWIKTTLINQTKTNNFLITFFPQCLKGYEKELTQACFDNQMHFVALYNEKNIIYIEINQKYKDSYSQIIKKNLEKLKFKGKTKEALFEGYLENINDIDNIYK